MPWLLSQCVGNVVSVVDHNPPPPNVPALDGDGQPTTTVVNVRDKLAVHREDKDCAVCHDKLDPIGFALESFDPVGRFRKVYADGSEIDAPEIMRMVDSVTRQDYRFRSVIEQVALAKLFRGAPVAIGVESK